MDRVETVGSARGPWFASLAVGAECLNIIFAGIKFRLTAGRDPRPPAARSRTGLVHAFSQDLRYALRTFRRQPAFVVSAVTLLAFAIGANTAVFSLVRAYLL